MEVPKILQVADAMQEFLTSKRQMGFDGHPKANSREKMIRDAKHTALSHKSLVSHWQG